MKIDIHSHVIPGVDDGAKDFQESKALLKMLASQGVDAVIATPHFNEHHTDTIKYKERIIRKFNELKSLENIPELFLGYEFKYFRGMSNSGLPEQFCLGNSNYILIELPYEDISLKSLQEIEKIRYDNGLIPILAHIDRYVAYKNYKELLEFLSEGEILAQINANAVYCENHKKNALNLIKKGIINFVGSDTHSLKNRPPNIDKFFEIAEKKFPETIDVILHNNKVLYKYL